MNHHDPSCPVPFFLLFFGGKGVFVKSTHYKRMPILLLFAKEIHRGHLFWHLHVGSPKVRAVSQVRFSVFFSQVLAWCFPTRSRSTGCRQTCTRLGLLEPEGFESKAEGQNSAGLLKRSPFLQPFETCGFFNTRRKGNHHVQVAMFRCIM